MNRDQAYTLVRQTFTQAFDKNRFSNLSRNLLNHIDESKASSWNSQYVKDAFKSHVQRYERLGTYTSPEKEKLDVLIVHLTHESKLERARTAIRNFVADHLKTRDEKDAALVAFVSPSETTWRFSYVKMEYATVEKDSGKASPEQSRRVGVETRLTPARRFSYIVGEGESCHTAQTRFLDLLQDTEADPTLAEIEEAFSVEAVTKEFFTKYAELFEKIRKALEKLVAKDKTIGDEFTAKGVNTVDFAKKLMGQIVFLYFIQKKGWLGVGKGQDWGSGPRDFLRRLADGEYGKYNNFFNDILEPLFYDTLATDRGHAAWCNRFNCRMPFLNGGLFEPLGDYDWRKTDIILPNKLFTNSEFVEEGITGTGVLDVFDRYNFTVNEAEPLEKEVAIDPEMLGKVFENLIEDNRRKGLGAYYTPREIVHYMCQESLINYLDTAINQTSEVLKTSEVSNVIPRADLETFVHLGEQISHYESVDTRYPIKMPKSIEQQARTLDEKLAEITVCDPAVGSGAFPVGMMTEIVRARSALTPYFNDIHERTPYHFKRHAIQNCLYGVDIDPGAVEIAKLRLWLSLVVDEEDVKRIKPLPNLDYKIVAGNSLLGFPFKSQRVGEIEELKQRFFDETDHAKKAQLKTQVDKLLAECFAASKKSLGYAVDFDFEIFFSEVFQRKGGFDVVIANPPYVRQEQIKELKPLLQKQYKCYTGTADLYVYFYERGFKLLQAGGVLTYISSNKYFRSAYGEKLRRFLGSNAAVQQLIDFGDAPVFEAIAYPSIIVARKVQPDANEVRAFTWKAGPPIEDFAAIFQAKSFFITQSKLTADGWRLESSAVLRLLDKLRNAGQPLGEYVDGQIYSGIKTGLNEAFVVDRATRDRLIGEDKSSEEILKPFLRGRDVKRWQVQYGEQYLIKIESSENKAHPWSGKADKPAEKVFAETYPAIYRHLNQFRQALIQRGDKGHYFWELRSCTYWHRFERPKIIYPNICKRNEFAWDNENYLSNQKSFFIPDASKYLLGVLNSSTTMWLFSRLLAKLQNEFYEPSAIFMEKVPIPVTDKPKHIETLADKILAAKQRDPKADTTALEREIDRLVYQLYGLTPEEIAIVEESTRAK